MSKHTEGPWRVTRYSEGNVDSYQSFKVYDDAKEIPVTIANAQLIAAAPDLLAALELARIQIQADFNTRLQQSTERTANRLILDVIDKALNEAKGESLPTKG